MNTNNTCSTSSTYLTEPDADENSQPLHDVLDDSHMKTNKGLGVYPDTIKGDPLPTKEGDAGDMAEQEKRENTKEWYNVVHQFASTTSAHGIGRIFESEDWTSRISWTIIVIVACVVFVGQTSLLVVQYLEYNVNTKVNLKSDSEERPFPSVTVCNTNKLRRSAVLQSDHRELLIVDSTLVLPHYGPCSDADFTCASGPYCVRKYLVCDGVNHCLDMSDETNCTYGQCGDEQFRCRSGSNNGICIDQDMACNGKKDCYNGEDEENCECKSTDFKCEYSKQCLPLTSFCDGVLDCDDGTDELSDACLSTYSNVALGKQTEQSSTELYPSQNAVDNQVDGHLLLKTCAATFNEYAPWWKVDLGDFFKIHEIIIYGHTDFRNTDNTLYLGQVNVSGNPDLPGQRCGDEIWNIEETKITRPCGPIIGRYVSVSIPTRNEKLILCEVQVMATDIWVMNAALHKNAMQSSRGENTVAFDAIDGIKNTNFWSGSCSLTEFEYEPWWRVDLGIRYAVYRVNVANRQDCCSSELSGAVVRVGETDRISSQHICGHVTYNDTEESDVIHMICRASIHGRYVSVRLDNITARLHLCEVEVFGAPLPEDLPNVAVHKEAEQISITSRGVPSRAVDGNRNPIYIGGESCIHTMLHSEPWWRVDLTRDYRVYQVIFVNRGDCCGERNVGAVARVGPSLEIKKNPKCWGPLQENILIGFGTVIPIDCYIPLIGQYVSVQLENHANWMNFCEIEVKAEVYINHRHTDFNVNSIAFFEVMANKVLLGANTIDIPKLSVEGCAEKCLSTKDFMCLSFNYKSTEQLCSLLVNARYGDNRTEILQNNNYVHYESLSTSVVDPVENGTVCPIGFYRCGSGECVHPYRVCDVLHHCSDKSDEVNCTSASADDITDDMSPNWFDPFVNITSDIRIYEHFLANYHPRDEYRKVKGESPPDWNSFKSYSMNPDYSDLDQMLQLSREEIRELGHQGEDFILQCAFDDTQCDLRDFQTFQDEKYGNCFTFNHRQQHFAKKPGSQNGFRLTLFSEQAEYTSVHGKNSGVRVVINPTDRLPMPQQDGFTIKPGEISSIAVKETEVIRVRYPWGNCTDGSKEEGLKIDGFPQSYSVQACEKACMTNALETYCGCTDSIHRDMPTCKILDDDDARCKSLMYYFYRRGLLQCDCKQPCHEMQYSLTMSQSQWPSNVYLKHLLQTLHNKNAKTRIINDAESARSNFLRLEIYFESLSYEVITEYKAYTWEDLLSDIGGTLGLYIGLSVITVCEIVKLFIDICHYCRNVKERRLKYSVNAAKA